MTSRFLLLYLLWPVYVLACGSEKDENSIRFSVFNPMLGSTIPEWVPFCYSEHYWHVLPDERPIFDIDTQQNCREWIDYFGGTIAFNDVEDILYHTYPDDFLYAARCKEWTAFAGNTFVAALRQHPPALQYMLFAKRQESLHNNQETAESIWDIDMWRNDKDMAATKRLWQDLEAAMQTSADDVFLQKRYAFQLMRMEQNNDYTIRLYEECLQNEKSILQTWALPYLAKAYQAKSQKLKANLTTALAFDQCESKKIWAYERLSYGELMRLLPQTHNINEKKAVLALKVFKNKAQALKDLKALYNNDPETRYLHLLINREVNKLESWLLSAEKGANNCEMVHFYRMDTDYKDQVEMGYAYKNCIKDQQYAIELLQFVNSLPLKAWQGNEAYRHLVLAHLYLLSNNYVAAWQHTRSMPKHCPKSYRTQRAIEEAMILARLQNIESPATQQAIYERLQVVVAQRTQAQKYYNSEEGENDDTLEELLSYLSLIFAKQNNIVMQGLLQQRSEGIRDENIGWNSEYYYPKIAFWDNYAQPEHLDKLLHFKHKKNKTPFERFISLPTWPDDAVYRELQGTLYFRQNNYAAAVKAFDQMQYNLGKQNDYTNYSFYCPSSNELIEVDNDICPNDGSSDAWTKEDIAREALRLEKALTKSAKPNRALYLYQMGNLHFNTSYWGKSWEMYDYEKSIYDYPSVIADKQPCYDKPNYCAEKQRKLKRYYTCQTAITYYKQALQFSQNNPELQAKIYLMLHTILYKQYLGKQVLYAEKDMNPPKPFEHEYFLTFSKKFKHTRAYKIWKSTCDGK